MQIINVDFQQPQLIDILINDFRTDKRDATFRSPDDFKVSLYKSYIERDSDDITEG